jgi:hypothetical protein
LKDRRWLLQENVIGDPYSILCIRQHYAIFEVSYSSYHEIEQMFADRNVLFLNLRCISSNCFWYFVTTEKYYTGYIKGITVSYLKSCRRRLGIWPSQMRINLATRSGASKTNTYACINHLRYFNWFSLSISWFLHPQPEKRTAKTNCSVSYLKSCRRRLGIWPSQMRINLATA